MSRKNIFILALPFFIFHCRNVFAQKLAPAYIVIYGNKTLTPTISAEEARNRGLLYPTQIPKKAVTKLFSTDFDHHESSLVFSDEDLSQMILSPEGGPPTVIKGYVNVVPNKKIAFALMASRHDFRNGLQGEELRARDFYELSLDGKNSIRYVCRYPSYSNFAVSPNGDVFMYFEYSPNRLLFCSTIDGHIMDQITFAKSLNFAFFPELSWSPDGDIILISQRGGPDSDPEYYLIHLSDKRVEKINPEGVADLDCVFPDGKHLLGRYLTYGQYYRFGINGEQGSDLHLPRCNSWNAELSPKGDYLAYDCEGGISISRLADSKTVNMPIKGWGRDVLGWVLGWIPG